MNVFLLLLRAVIFPVTRDLLSRVTGPVTVNGCFHEHPFTENLFFWQKNSFFQQFNESVQAEIVSHAVKCSFHRQAADALTRVCIMEPFSWNTKINHYLLVFYSDSSKYKSQNSIYPVILWEVPSTDGRISVSQSFDLISTPSAPNTAAWFLTLSFKLRHSTCPSRLSVVCQGHKRRLESQWIMNPNPFIWVARGYYFNFAFYTATCQSNHYMYAHGNYKVIECILIVTQVKFDFVIISIKFI